MMRRIWKGMLRLWEADQGLSITLALLVTIVFVLPVLLTPTPIGDFVRDIAFSVLLIAGAVAALEWRWGRFGVAALAVAALLVRWAAVATPSEALVIGREASTLVLLMLFVTVVASRTYRSGPVTSQRIQGAIAVYLLLGLLWAHAYQLLHLVRPEAFSGAVDDAPGAQMWIYYSFVTLTTVGYGDITPLHPLARSLAISEALTGQLYLAVTLARLMALHIRARDED
jgi:hypothetical protein